MQRIPHDATKYRNNPVELVNIANRQRIGWLLDPYTKLLIPGNGTNGSTSIPDLTGKTVTVAGNTNISTAQSIIGGSSIYFDGSGDYLSLADSDDWDFGSGDFTIDFWIKTTQTGTNAPVIGHRNSNVTGNWALSTNINGTQDFNFYYWSTTHTNITTGVNICSGNWVHIAICRNSGTLTCYIDGVVRFQQSLAVSFGADTILNIGRDTMNALYFAGYLSHIRITKGIARWTSNSTTPSKITDYYQMNNYIGA